MDNKDKINKCVPWIDPEERVTAHFLDETSLVAEVTGCTEQVADLSFAPRVPHMKQHVSVPLSRTEVSEDLGRYTRDPARPFKRNRLMWVVDENRPAVIYSWGCPLCDEVGDRSDCTVRGGVEAGSSGRTTGPARKERETRKRNIQ